MSHFHQQQKIQLFQDDFSKMDEIDSSTGVRDRFK